MKEREARFFVGRVRASHGTILIELRGRCYLH